MMSTRGRIARSIAAIGMTTTAAALLCGTSAAFAASQPTAPSPHDAYVAAMSGITDTVARDTDELKTCAVTGPPFKPGDTKCPQAPTKIVNMIDLQAAALDRLENPQSHSYVGPPPAELAPLVTQAKDAAKEAYFPVANAMYSCKSGTCDATKYRQAASAATTYASALSPWTKVGAARVINGCEIKPGTKCPGVDLSGQDLSDANLSGADLTGANLSGTNLEDATLTNAVLNKVTAISAKFAEARMSGAQLNGAQLGSADFYRTHLETAVLTGSDLARTNFDHTFMNKAVVNRTTGSGQVFSSAQMTGVDATGSSFVQADFTSSNLRGLDYSRNTQVGGSKFTNATCPNGSKASGTPAACSEFGG